MTLLLRAPREVDEHSKNTRSASVQHFPVGVVVAAMIVSIALRARFVTTPLTSDEGGYVAVARAWAAGKHLYTEAWVDRPQGLLVLFRFWEDLIGGSGPAIRIMAMVFGCIAVAAVAYTVFTIAGPRAAGAAALLVAVASSNARIEGFIANGELLAGGLAAAGVAAACAYLFRGRGMSWLYLSGAIAGLAMSIKQSGCDGFLAVMLCIVVGGFTGERRWRAVLRESALVVAGLASVLVLLFIHGLLVGLGAWWYAIAGYRLQGINATSRADWHRFNCRSRRHVGLAGPQPQGHPISRADPCLDLLCRHHLPCRWPVPSPLLGHAHVPDRCGCRFGGGQDQEPDRGHHHRLPRRGPLVDQHDARDRPPPCRGD